MLYTDTHTCIHTYYKQQTEIHLHIHMDYVVC